MYRNYCDFMEQHEDGYTWEKYHTYRHPDLERVGHCYKFFPIFRKRNDVVRMK